MDNHITSDNLTESWGSFLDSCDGTDLAMNSIYVEAPSDGISTGGSMVRDTGGVDNGHQFPYERLRVYHKLRAMRKRMQLLSKQFPADERYGLTSQLRRSASSAVLNIVEGSLRTTGKAQANFTAISFGSLHEAFECISLAEEDDYLPDGTYECLRPEMWHITRMLSALRKAQLGK